MIFLFSNNSSRLMKDAKLMQEKNHTMHPGMSAFYLTKQEKPLHTDVRVLDHKSQFDKGSCKLANGEAAIIIGHGGDDNHLYNHSDDKVSDAAGRLMAQIAEDNPGGGYNIFLAACGGAVQQPLAQASLLSILVDKAAALKDQLKLGSIKCWSYAVEAGWLDLQHGVPNDRIGMHIYGVVTEKAVQYHCGYDTGVTTQLKLDVGGNYTKTSPPEVRIPLQNVMDWHVKDKGVPGMDNKFKDLYATLIPTK